MEDEKKEGGMDELRKTVAGQFVLPAFDPTLVTRATIEKELQKHEDAYMGAIVTSRIEMKFLNDSIDSIEKEEKENPNGLATAQKHLERAKGNDNYFQNIKLDPSCIKAMGHLNNIESKITEVKTQLWTIKYHADKIAEVKGYLAQFDALK